MIQEHDLPKVVFHSLRHSSITYKLKLNGGDIKAVQGDFGHAQAMEEHPALNGGQEFDFLIRCYRVIA